MTSLHSLRALLADKLGGNCPSTILSADRPTGQQPMSLSDIDEHTEHYLALENGEGKYRGMLTGILGYLGLFFASFAIAFWLDGRHQSAIDTFLVTMACLLFPFLWEVLRPLPLPILFKRSPINKVIIMTP